MLNFRLPKQLHNSSSLLDCVRSIFSLSVPSNKNGSCGIILIFSLKSQRFKFLMLVLSIIISPKCNSIPRNNARSKLLLPDPVRPHILKNSLHEIILNTCFEIYLFIDQLPDFFACFNFKADIVKCVHSVIFVS